MAEVILKNVSKVYEGGNIAAQDINLEIKDKEFVVLVGPSGCGKSTTLRMIAGLEEITTGELYIDGKFMNNVTPKDRDIAMVFQNYALYPHMTVYENMAFGLKLRKFKKEDIKKRVSEAAKILELEPYLDRKPKALSGGQRQRVAVGRAIVRKPKVFLFDEPLSNLDAKLRVQMRTEISRLHQSLQATMIYVTHDQTEAMTMGSKIVVMKDGYIQQVDAPLNLYNNPVNKFVAGFIGSPAMNFIKGFLLKKDDGVYFESSQKTMSFKINRANINENKEVWLGVRPEDILDERDRDHSCTYSEINVNLDLVEPMGNEVFLYLNIENTQVISRVPARDVPAIGINKKLLININKIHVFDVETEQSLID